MSLIEGIGDEVTQFFIGLIVIIVVTVAWWTTNIAEQRHVRTVLLLERRRHRTQRRLTNHTETVTITDGTSHLSPVNEESAVENSTPQSSCRMESVQEDTSSRSAEVSSNSDTGHEIRDEQNIIESMDNDTSLLRQRRVAFYDNWNSESQGTSQNINESLGASNVAATKPISQRSADEIVMEHNYSKFPCTSNIETVIEDNNSKNEDASDDQTSDQVVDNENIEGITIKLKYINDDLKLVDGKLDELLGDFKKRHFQSELSANKLIRLIFNGQVLQPDTQTLANCGLFNNCVVHCLIHQKRTPVAESTAHESRREGYSFPNPNGMPNVNNQREWDLGNFLFAFISLILLAAWYFRYVYAHLYTVTATVGLILVTGIFTIILIGMYLPDNEPMPNPTIRIARERVQLQQ